MELSAKENEMLAKTVLETIGLTSMGFYSRFLFALCKDCKKAQSGGHWMKLRLHHKRPSVVQLHQDQKTISRAA
jgi:hypothetical protein